MRMISFYEELLGSTSEIKKLKKLLEYDEIVDSLIFKKVLSENDYLKISKSENSKIDLVFDILTTKSNQAIEEGFEILKKFGGADVIQVIDDFRNNIVFSIHQKGGFPKLNKYVRRTDEEKKVKEYLPKIKLDRSLVVHGRIGEGKSYLVCECLREENLTRKYFDNKLYWINVGEYENEKPKNNRSCMQPLTRLLRMMVQKKSKEIYQYDEDDVVQELKFLFANDFQRSLVILDNVRSLEVIKKFQEIYCNLIIISNLKKVNNAEFIEVGCTGFSLSETINLFAQYLDCLENSLDRYIDHIREINDLCKGHPSTLALLGAFLNSRKDQALNNHKPWNYIKDKISKGEMDEFDADEQRDRKFTNALQMCIDTLKQDEYKSLYYQFAIFPKDANISSEVLEVFWQKSSQEVRTIMSAFENRSLINSFYNLKKQSYIYVIHDLFLMYLRKYLSKEKKRDLHARLIEMYEERYMFHNLPDDNYILPFLGYHLMQAEMNYKFESFLDLRFIEHKIKLVGGNNMEQDLISYEKEIINGKKDLREKWERCLKFVRDNREEFKSPKTDILQLALPTLNKDAQRIMENNEAMSIHKLYFTTKLSAGRVKNLQEFDVREEITAMCYCVHSNVPKVLLGLSNGNILLYCLQTCKEFDQYEGHKDSVYDIKVSSDESSFLSVSDDASVKLWQFFSPRLSFDATEIIATSPKMLQTDHFSVFSSKKHPYKEFYYNEENDYIISANFSNCYEQTKLVITGTHQGRVIIWNAVTRERIIPFPESGIPIENIYFNNDNSKIFFSKQEKILIYKYKDEMAKYASSIDTKGNIANLLFTQDDSAIVVGDHSVTLYRSPHQIGETIYENPKDKVTVAMAKERYFVIGCGDKVFVHDIDNGGLVEELELNKTSSTLAIHVSWEDSIPMSKILINLNKGYIQQYNIFMTTEDKPKEKQNLVTSHWLNNTPLLALANNRQTDNTLTFQREFSIISQYTETEKVLCFTFSLCGNRVIFSLASGLIKEHIFKKKQTKTILQAEGNVKSIQCFELGKSANSSASSINLRSSEDNEWIVIVMDVKIIVYHKGKIQEFSWDIPIFQVFQLSTYSIACIDVGDGIFVIELSDDEIDSAQAYVGTLKFILYGRHDVKVNTANVCMSTNLLASCYNYVHNHHKNYVNVYDLTHGVASEDRQVKNLDMENYLATCCAFSISGSLLAVGRNDGKVLVFNLLNNYASILLTNCPSTVSFLRFSPGFPPILVVVGREISWWNLSDFEKQGPGNSINQHTLPKKLPPTSFDKDFWIKKTSHDKYPYLLQLINLYSTPIYFSVSRSFETFLIVDDESRIYILNCLKTAR